MEVLRLTTETELIKTRQKTLEDLTTLQDSQWTVLSFPKLLKACLEDRQQLRIRTRRKRRVFRADREEIQLRVRELAQRKVILFQLLKNLSFLLKISFSSLRNFLMEEIMHSKSLIYLQEKLHRQRFTREMQIMAWLEVWVGSPWMGYQIC